MYGCAPTRIWCPGSPDQGVSHVSKNLSLTPRMKHTRVPRTIRRDTRRLAIETSSTPSLHIFRSRIRNHIAIRIENRKKPNGPNRKSNRLTKKKIPHTSRHVELLLGLIDVVQCLHKLRTFLQKQHCRGNPICRTLF